MDARPTRVRSAGWAFLMALVIPGSGQIYSGKKLRGVVSLVFFLAGALGVLAFNMASPFWGVSLRCALALYVYSFLDAYFTSLELNAGNDPPPYQNPRVATALNLLTNGFGYFYLGERAKGLIVFLGMRLLGGALAQYQVVWELVSGLLAIDAYRIARKALQGGHGAPMLSSSGVMQLGLSETPVRVPSSPPPEPEWGGQPPPSRLPVYVPAAMACAVGAIYAGLVVLGSVMPDYHVIDQSQSTFQQTSEERIYANPRYGVEVHIPQNWNFDIPDHTSLIQASSADGICRASLLIDSISPVSGLEREKNGVISRVLSENANLRLAGQRTANLGAHPGYEITFSLGLDDDEYLTRYVIARRGMTLYALVLTNRARFDEDCRRLTDVIRLRLVLPMDE